MQILWGHICIEISVIYYYVACKYFESQSQCSFYHDVSVMTHLDSLNLQL